MNKIFESKTKTILISIAYFILLAIIIKLSPAKDILVYTLYPISFFIITFLYTKNKKVCWDFPMTLTMIYIVVGYFLIFNNISSLRILVAFLSSVLANIILLLIKNKGIKIKKENIELIGNIPNTIKRIFTYSLPLILTIILEIYYKMCTFNTPSLKVEFKAILLLLIIIYSIYFFILSIVKTTFRANIIYGLIFLILFIVNQMRIFYTSDTLLLTDFLFLQNTGEIVNFMDVTFLNSVNYILCPTILVIIIFIWLFIIDKKCSQEIKKLKIRIPMLIITSIIITLLYMPTKTLDKYILTKVYDYNKTSDYTISVSNTRYYYKYGVISGMYGKFLESRRYEPDNYDEEGLLYTINNVPKNNGTWGNPNVIVIFSESFWDVSQLDGITFTKDITSNYHKLQNIGKNLQMISPSYGGISANVEYEILTGGSLNYFSKGYIPYMQLYNKSTSTNNPSVIKEFKNNNYKTKILNSSSKGMFNCDYVYDIYDVDERNHLYDEINLNGEYVTDEYLTDKIIEYFDNKPKDEKTFFFTITMGGHMPYYEERYDNYDFEVAKTSYNDEITGTIKSYAEGIYMADKELGRLYDYINTIDEPTLIVFFGDHLPHLQTKSGNDALFQTGYLNNNYDLESVYRQFNTQALIVSNYDITYDDTTTLGPDLLLTYVMNNMNLELSPYYRWLYTTKDELSCSNYVVTRDNDGKLYYTLGLEGTMKETYEMRKKVQYMMFK